MSASPVPARVAFPCLRCGRSSVLVWALGLLVAHGRTTIPCRACGSEHYLAVRGSKSTYEVCYQRYTRRHELGLYDQDDPEVLRFENASDVGEADDCNLHFSGPITVYPRKKRFTEAEVTAIWRTSTGKCHLCARRWDLNQRGRTGWHIDHVIPHIGGGPDVEMVPNFRVACATCNLKKGRGYTEKTIRIAIRRFVEQLDRAG